MGRRAFAAEIAGTGRYLPRRRITNEDLVRNFGLDSSDEWIREHLGITERRWVEDNELTSDLAAGAARAALDASGIAAGDLARIIVSTTSGDVVSPATACIVQHKIGATCPAEDKNATCAGFLFGLDHAARLVATGVSPVLVVGADCKSRQLDHSDRVTFPIFGDGAGACVVRPASEEGRGIIDVELLTDGTFHDAVTIPSGARPYLRIKEGRRVFEHAIHWMPRLGRIVLERSGLTPSDVDWLVPHQANRGIIIGTGKALGIPLEKTVIDIDRYGNTVAASVAIALDELARSGRLQRGQLVLLLAIGAGAVGGAVLYRW